MGWRSSPPQKNTHIYVCGLSYYLGKVIGNNIILPISQVRELEHKLAQLDIGWTVPKPRPLPPKREPCYVIIFLWLLMYFEDKLSVEVVSITLTRPLVNSSCSFVMDLAIYVLYDISLRVWKKWLLVIWLGDPTSPLQWSLSSEVLGGVGGVARIEPEEIPNQSQWSGMKLQSRLLRRQNYISSCKIWWQFYSK